MYKRVVFDASVHYTLKENKTKYNFYTHSALSVISPKISSVKIQGIMVTKMYVIYSGTIPSRKITQLQTMVMNTSNIMLEPRCIYNTFQWFSIKLAGWDKTDKCWSGQVTMVRPKVDLKLINYIQTELWSDSCYILGGSFVKEPPHLVMK